MGSICRHNICNSSQKSHFWVYFYSAQSARKLENLGTPVDGWLYLVTRHRDNGTETGRVDLTEVSR